MRPANSSSCDYPLMVKMTNTAMARTLLLLLLVAVNAYSDNTAPVVNYHYRVVDEYPHDDQFFTQGLAFYRGLLYESSGQRGHSRVQTRTLNTLNPLRAAALQQRYFGEGITILNGRLYQLTWQSRQGFIYNAETLASTGRFRITGQGWGITNNGQQLIYSDGSNRLRFLNPDDFSLVNTLNVTHNGKAVTRLNELEWVEGRIYANIWQSSWIVIINPHNGQVEGRVQLGDLLPKALRRANTDVLNGIAYDQHQQRLFVTGKNWPRLYQIELLTEP